MNNDATIQMDELIRLEAELEAKEALRDELSDEVSTMTERIEDLRRQMRHANPTMWININGVHVRLTSADEDRHRLSCDNALFVPIDRDKEIVVPDRPHPSITVRTDTEYRDGWLQAGEIESNHGDAWYRKEGAKVYTGWMGPWSVFLLNNRVKSVSRTKIRDEYENDLHLCALDDPVYDVLKAAGM